MHLEVREAVKDWLDYRTDRHLPTYTERGFKALLNRLSEWGPSRTVAAIRYASAQNYQGIFEERRGHHPPSHPVATENRTKNLDALRERIRR